MDGLVQRRLVDRSALSYHKRERGRVGALWHTAQDYAVAFVLSANPDVVSGGGVAWLVCAVRGIRSLLWPPPPPHACGAG